MHLVERNSGAPEIAAAAAAESKDKKSQKYVPPHLRRKDVEAAKVQDCALS